MSVQITIKQKGMFKKKITLEDLTAGRLSYGRYDSNIMVEDEVDETGLTLYDPACVARGISVDWTTDETSQIGVYLSLPTSMQEIDEMYDLVLRICKKWQVDTFKQDDSILFTNDINEQREIIKDTSLKGLKDILTSMDNICIFGAYWPLYLDEDIVNQLKVADDLTLFEEYLHNQQAKDLYYARPHFYQGQDGIFGVFTITQTVDTIFPTKPYVPFGINNPQTNEPLTVENWYVTLYSTTLNDILGSIKYSDFINNIDIENIEKYDNNNIVITGLSLEYLQELIAKYKTEIK